MAKKFKKILKKGLKWKKRVDKVMWIIVPIEFLLFILSAALELPPGVILVTYAATLVTFVYTLFDNGYRGMTKKEISLKGAVIRGQKAQLLGFVNIVFAFVLLASTFFGGIGLALFLLTSN